MAQRKEYRKATLYLPLAMQGRTVKFRGELNTVYQDVKHLHVCTGTFSIDFSIVFASAIQKR